MVKQLGNTHRQGKDARTLRRRSAALFGIAALAGVLGSAQAATYTYTPTNSSADLWSVGTDWTGGVPASNAATTLTFVGNNTNTVSVNNTNTDDNTGGFQANIVNLQGTGPASGAGSVTIAASGSGAYLDMVNNVGTNPVINLNALAGSGSGLTYNVSAPIKVNTGASSPSLYFDGTGTSTFNFSGGITSSSTSTTVTTNGTFTMNLIGAASNIAGTLRMINGTIIDSADMTIGNLYMQAGSVFIQNGSTVTANDSGSPNMAGSYTLNSGTFSSPNNFNVGYRGGPASLTINGGSFSVGSKNLQISVNNSGVSDATTIQNNGVVTAANVVINLYSTSGSAGTGLYELNGGTLETGRVVGQGSSIYGSSTFDFNGGTLQASASTTGLMYALTTANVQAHGAIIDTNGFNDTISQNLVHDSSLGSTPDGGLTKLGTGTLALSGVNTYTGNTTVSDGTLQINSPHLSISSTVSIANGAKMNLDYIGTDTIAALFLNGVSQAAGTYSYSNDPTFFGNFTGSLTVSSVPEPAALGLMGLGGLGILLSGKRRRII